MTGSKPDKIQLARQAMIKHLTKPLSVNAPDQFARLLTGLFMEAHEPLKAKAAEALMAGWDAATHMIEAYLDAFTHHPGLDISDNGPNFLTTLFPRTIAGEDSHDCGVFANRIARWLLDFAAFLKSKHKIDLGLELFFIFLPVHVGLITKVSPPALGKSSDGLPTLGLLITHNNHFNRFTAKELRDLEAQWLTTPPAADPDPTTAEAKAQKFIEDLAASKYISGVDMPVLSRPVLKKGAKPTPDAIFKTYKPLATTSAGDVFAPPVNSTVGDVSQFFLEYLAILEDRADFINKVLLAEFWRSECPFIFNAIFNPDGKGVWDASVANIDLEQYHERMTRLLFKFADRLKAYTDKEAKNRQDISKLLDKRPKDIIAKIARRVFSDRLASSAFSEMKETLTLVAAHNQLIRLWLNSKPPRKADDFPPPPPYMYQTIKDYVF